jgi:UDP-glucuronate 4-epimerase
MSVLVTGVAGFIGSHVAQALLTRGETVLGVDCLTPYYDVTLKQARLDRLVGQAGFTFQNLDIADPAAVTALFRANRDLHQVVHLAAQAGVRHSLVDPYSYVTANVMGQVTMLEACRDHGGIRHFVYASSSSVYGGNKKLPFSEEDETKTPLSIYAATKLADEGIAHSYSHLFRLPTTGLRFFTVYGPWGRPDMAAFLFARAMLAGEPIKLFNQGNLRRDFTYIDDITVGVLAALDKPPPDGCPSTPPQRIYNLGNSRSEDLGHFIAVLEQALGVKAKIVLLPMQPGDVAETFADVSRAARELGFSPSTTIDVGLPRFVAWYRDYHGLNRVV